MVSDMMQVFEHQKIKIGKDLSQAQWQALVIFAQQNAERYYKILHNGVQFKQYVGVLQVGNLTIEILPKIDENSDAPIQQVLVDLLRVCGLLPPESRAIAHLKDRKGSLLDIYILQFLDKVEQLLREGLMRTYVLEQKNQQFFKGKILMNQQLVMNAARPDRFFTQTFKHTYQNSFNQLIYSALKVLKTMPLRNEIAVYLQSLYQQFPPMAPWRNALPALEKLRFNRHSLRYKSALQTALLILQQLQPDVRMGQLPVLAILFDMNQLFEWFIFKQLQSAVHENKLVKRQVPKPFWNRRPIQPDIVLMVDNQVIVIDTKWKKLQKVSPTMEDLRQLFVYNQYFNAKDSVLVYPHVHDLEDLPPVPFQPTKADSETYYCQVRFVALVRDGQLNRELGQELLQKILMSTSH